MNLIFRLLFTLFRKPFRDSVGVLGPCSTPFRCWPSDLDLLGHMNNGKYFSIMDVARVDLMGRAGLLSSLSKKGWYPVIVAETMKFSRSIQPFSRFYVETRVLGWDEKAVLLSQKFIVKGKCVGEGVVRSRFLKKTGGSVLPDALIDLANYTGPRPQLEPWVEAWNEAQK